MSVTTESPETLIILAADQTSFYEFLRVRQRDYEESLAVILDRRIVDRRVRRASVADDRRRRERRTPPPAAAVALMRVLGFAILHRRGDTYTVESSARRTEARGLSRHPKTAALARRPAASRARRP